MYSPLKLPISKTHPFFAVLSYTTIKLIKKGGKNRLPPQNLTTR
jgi:hypothetical protein